jgi:3-methyladenine DNA glycosylase AlkD
LKKIGKTVAKEASHDPENYVPLAQLLWNDFGREGRVIAAIIWGKIELADPENTLPILRDLCRGCHTWEDADRLAMDGIEPIVRKQPDRWLAEMEPWLEDSNKWVRRVGVTVIGRLPMKHADYTGRCLALSQQLLLDTEEVVKKAVSFAIRLCARGDAGLVRDFLALQVPPDDPRATWVLCDAIRSMAPKLRPEFVPLLPNYKRWAADPNMRAKDRRSVESAIRTLKAASA